MKRGGPLKRTTPLRAKVPMKRTASFSSTKPERAAPAPRKRMKSTRPKMTAIRKSAKGEDCLIQLPGAPFHDPATTVLCHSNQLAAGKGMGLKAPDTAAAYGCHYCHDVVDGRRPLPPGLTQEAMLEKFERAIVRTHARLREKGIEV